MTKRRNWSAYAALGVMIAVSLGAFGAHYLRSFLDQHSQQIFEKANFYHFFHTLAVIFIPVLNRCGLISERSCDTVCRLHLLGTVLFSGSLYLLAVSHQRWLGAITPLGGVSFIIGWGYLALSLTREAK